MNEFKMNDGTIGVIIFIYKDLMLYGIKNDPKKDIYAAKVSMNNKSIIINPINETEFKLLNEKYQSERSELDA